MRVDSNPTSTRERNPTDEIRDKFPLDFVYRRPLAVAITMATLLAIASMSSAQLLRRTRRVPTESNPAKASETSAPQIDGEPGSPDATTTIDGKQLPPPDPKFGGVIKDNALQSKAWWAPRVVPPKKAPNVLLIMTDDVGFAAPSTFGGVIPTPALDPDRQERVCATRSSIPRRSARPRARR